MIFLEFERGFQKGQDFDDFGGDLFCFDVGAAVDRFVAYVLQPLLKCGGNFN